LTSIITRAIIATSIYFIVSLYAERPAAGCHNFRLFWEKSPDMSIPGTSYAGGLYNTNHFMKRSYS
jgi:hypothetical protein